MRLITSEFASRLANGATMTCLCWRLTRSDGFVLAATEHDRALVVDGVSYSPGGALEAGSFTQSAGLAPGQAAAGGVLADEAITEADLAAGLWDGARVDVMRVDWERPDLFLRVWSGRLSEVTRGPGGFQAELVSLKADLERPVGRVYARACDAVLGEETLLEAARRHLLEIPAGAAGAGDVLLFRMAMGVPAKHCGIATGEGTLVHAYWGRSVVETRLVPWWQRRVVAAFRFPGLED
jgi:NlpC/P60 family putative phage cell wall peptidase